MHTIYEAQNESMLSWLSALNFPTNLPLPIHSGSTAWLTVRNPNSSVALPQDSVIQTSLTCTIPKTEKPPIAFA